MAARATRNKIRFQAGKAINMLVRSQEHLAKLDVMADGQSEYINKNLPILVGFSEELKRTLEQFREGL